MWKFAYIFLALSILYFGYEAIFEGIVHTGKGGKAIKHIDGNERVIGLLFILPAFYIIYLITKSTNNK